MTRYVLCCIVVLFFISCKKKKNISTECSSQIYGYAIPKNSGGVQSCSFGAVNTSTASITPFATFPAIMERKSAFNSNDNCYYIYLDDFYKIGQDGKTTVLESADSMYFDALVYNNYNNKFYAIGASSLIEIEVNGNKYTEKRVAHFIHSSYYSSLTVDNNGDVYYITQDYDTVHPDRNYYYIEKYHPGNLSSTVVASDGSQRPIFSILGLEFNKNDNMLYALRQSSTELAMQLIRIDPVKGTITRPINKFLFPIFIDAGNCSTCIDPCTNRYIISQYDQTTGTATLDQIDMTGAIVQHNETNFIFMGLSAKQTN